MACDILKGRSLACKDSRTGIRYVDFGIYDGDTYTVSAQEIASLPAGLTEVFRYEVKGAGNSLIETATVNNDNRTIEIVQALALNLPKLGKDTEVELQSLLYGRVVAFIHDYNGNVKAVGIDSGLEATTGVMSTETSGYTIALEARDNNFAPFLASAAKTALLALVSAQVVNP